MAGAAAMAAAAEMAAEEEKEVAPAAPPAMVVGIDDSEHSFYALEWSLSRFFSGAIPPFKLVIVYAKRPPSSVVGLAGAGAIDVMPFVESDLTRIAEGVIEKAKELCAAKSIGDVVYEVVEGDARNVLCEAIERHQAEILAVGSHGYGTMKRAVLGSVSDYCAHHAHCTVMIVKKPKSKN